MTPTEHRAEFNRAFLWCLLGVVLFVLCLWAEGRL